MLEARNRQGARDSIAVSRNAAKDRRGISPVEAQAIKATGASRPQTSAARPAFAMWLEDEHWYMAQESAIRAGYDGEVRLADDYTLPFGAISVLADYFDSVDQLREFARNPSHTGAGTREEIEYLLDYWVYNQDRHNSDPTLDEEIASRYSQDARENADARYFALLATNSHHFLHSHPPGNAAFKDSLPTSSHEGGHCGDAKGAYEAAHLQAMKMAAKAGKKRDKATLEVAMAYESFALHFLTDAFASGHMTVPRASLASYWNTQFPLYQLNLAGYISTKLAENMKVLGGAVPRVVVYNVAQKSVVDALPPFTFGDIVAGAYHDYDNHCGVHASSGQSPTVHEFMAYGDGHFSPDIDVAPEVGGTPRPNSGVGNSDQMQAILAAGAASVQEVQDAYGSGTLGVSRIVAEQFPREDWPRDYPHRELDVLLDDPEFAAALQLFFAEKANQLRLGVATQSEDVQEIFEDEVIAPVLADPVSVLRSVLDWTPAASEWGWSREHARAYCYYEQVAATPHGLASLSDEARAQLIGAMSCRPNKKKYRDAIAHLQLFGVACAPVQCEHKS